MKEILHVVQSFAYHRIGAETTPSLTGRQARRSGRPSRARASRSAGGRRRALPGLRADLERARRADWPVAERDELTTSARWSAGRSSSAARRARTARERPGALPAARSASIPRRSPRRPSTSSPVRPSSTSATSSAAGRGRAGRAQGLARRRRVSRSYLWLTEDEARALRRDLRACAEEVHRRPRRRAPSRGNAPCLLPVRDRPRA
jgi:hypothetical protein